MENPFYDRLKKTWKRLWVPLNNSLQLDKRWSLFSNYIQKKYSFLIQKKGFRYALYSLGGLFILLLFFIISIYAGAFGKLPTEDELANLKQSLATQLLDRNGEVIGKYYIFDRRPIPYDELPKHLIDALIATEDVRFYKHDGVDKRSLMRVLFKTVLMSDEASGGGSTITQQLAKNIFGRSDGGKLGLIVSKVKEFIIAGRLEDVYTKEEIINLYFNTVPFPDNTYGIESASQKFFDKTTADLSLSEAATLVGTLKANYNYNPRLFPDRAKQRRDVVLRRMMQHDYLSPIDTMGLERDTIKLSYQRFDDQGIAPYFRELVRQEVGDLLKNYKKEDGSDYDMYRDGLTIYTTLDKSMQEYAEEGMREHMKELQEQYEKAYGNNPPWKRDYILQPALKELPYYKKLLARGLSEEAINDSLNVKKKRRIFSWQTDERVREISIKDSLSHYLSLLNTGFIVLDPKTGGILSYIGGIDFESFKYDHVSQSERMVGSVFKPIVYTAALENGIDPCSYYSAEEQLYVYNNREWSPSNSGMDQGADKLYSMKGALSNSVNTVAVKVILDVGIGKTVGQARRMGIENKLPYVPSLALGTAELRVRDLASAYTPYVNNGKPVKPYYITRITDRLGKEIANFEPKDPLPVAMSSFTRQAMIEMMRATVNEGTATRIRYKYKLPNDIAGKTGTTQDNKDGWFVGVTPYMVAVTWVGNDDYRIGFSNTGIGAGANSALPIYAKMMQKLNADTTFTSLTRNRFLQPSEEVALAMNCESVKTQTDTTSGIGSFLRSIFNKEPEKTKTKIYLDRQGNVIQTEEIPVIEPEGEEEEVIPDNN